MVSLFVVKSQLNFISHNIHWNYTVGHYGKIRERSVGPKRCSYRGTWVSVLPYSQRLWKEWLDKPDAGTFFTCRVQTSSYLLSPGKTALDLRGCPAKGRGLLRTHTFQGHNAPLTKVWKSARDKTTGKPRKKKRQFRSEFTSSSWVTVTLLHFQSHASTSTFLEINKGSSFQWRQW